LKQSGVAAAFSTFTNGCSKTSLSLDARAMTAFDLLISKHNQFIFVPGCINDESLLEVHQGILEISQKQTRKLAFLAHVGSKKG